MTNTPDAEIQTLLEDIWKRHLPQLLERLDLLKRVSETAASSTLPEEQRAEAQSVAHKLAGNLGMFGHNHAGDIAGQIEQIFKKPTPEKFAELRCLVETLRESLRPHFTTGI